MCDEIFSDEDGDVLEKSWKKTIEGVNKDGYRAGIDTGQEECLQEGFNSAFAHASKLLYIVSQQRGMISGKLSYNLMKPGKLSPGQEKRLQDLLGDIVEYETELLTFSKQLFTTTQHTELSAFSKELFTTKQQCTETSQAAEKGEEHHNTAECDRTVEGAFSNEQKDGSKQEKVGMGEIVKTIESPVTSMLQEFKTKYKEILMAGT